MRRWSPHLLLAGGLLALTGCGDTPPPPRTEKVLDLIAAIEQASVRADQPYSPERKVWGDRIVNTDGDDLYVLVLPEMALEYPDTPIHPGASLEYGFGPNKVLVSEAQGAVTFTIRVNGEPVAETPRTLTPGTDSFQPVTGSVSLGPWEGSKVTISLETGIAPAEMSSTGWPAAPSAWPSWFRARIVSEGRPVTDEDRILRVPEIGEDLLASFGPGSVVDQPSDMPVMRTDFTAEQEVEDGPLLLAPPPSRIDIQVSLPEDPVLEVDLIRLETPGADEASVDFRIEVDGEVVHTQRMQPGTPPRSQARLELARFQVEGGAGPPKSDVTISLFTQPVGDLPSTSPRVGWALPRLIRHTRVPRQEHHPKQPSVLWIVVDTLRADRLGAYGYSRPTSPQFDALAKRSLLFENMISQSSWTLPATASLLTGLYPLTHGVLSERLTYLDDSRETVAEVARQHGITTAAFVSNLLVTRQSNFDQGFETFQSLSWANARKLNRRFLDWLDNHEADRFFAYVHHIDPHDPYAAPGQFRDAFVTPDNPYAGLSDKETIERVAAASGGRPDFSSPQARDALRRIEDLYDSEVAYWDRCLGQLLEALEARGRLDSTVVIITADHGEEFLEHDMYQHGQQLYQETIRVPLLVHVPGGSPARIVDPVQSVDLKPTILELLGLPLSDLAHGRSVLSNPAPREVYSSTELGREPDATGFLLKQCVFAEGWKLISVPAMDRVELYRLAEDPGETLNRVHEEPDKRRALLEKLHRWIERTQALDVGNLRGFDTSTYERMKEVGYIGN